MAIVNDIAIAMTAPMAIDIALADATTVVIVNQYQEKNFFFALVLDMATAFYIALAMDMSNVSSHL